MTHSYELAGMHCEGCVERIDAALQTVPGVESAEVTLEPPRARVAMSRHVATEELDRAVRGAGDYRLTEMRDGASAGEAARHQRNETSDEGTGHRGEEEESLYPLGLIVAYLAGAVALAGWATGTTAPSELMRWFMAGFFLVFSFFKLLDLRGFSDAYRGYDLVARSWPMWGLAYPFVELALGAAYLANVWPLATHVTTLVVMLVGAAGVLKALLANRAIMCACLGTTLNLPMTKVTLIEDLTMAAMAGAMLAMMLW